MATDVSLIVCNLLSFYDFAGRTVIAVGAGGGQLIDYARGAKKIIAIDSDENALQKLKLAIAAKGLDVEFEFIRGDFFEVAAQGDAVLFEFCMHEMTDPVRALNKAQTMAPDVVVIDHAPGSEWVYYGLEDEMVVASWKAINTFTIRKKACFEAVHKFATYDELHEKLKSGGVSETERIQKFASQHDFTIPMPYCAALI